MVRDILTGKIERAGVYLFSSRIVISNEMDKIYCSVDCNNGCADNVLPGAQINQSLVFNHVNNGRILSIVIFITT